MELFFRDYFDHLQKLHGDIERVLQDLPQEALDWKPGEDMNSLGVLAFHVAGAERYWLGDVLAGESSNRNREVEFYTQDVTEAELKARLSSSLDFSRNVLDGLKLPDLHELRVSPRDGCQFNVSWVLNHALEHIAIHLGHMQVTRQFWEQKQA